MTTRIDIDDRRFIDSIENQILRLKNLIPIMKVISQDMKSTVDMSFRKGQDPYGNVWKALSIPTIVRRANRVRGQPAGTPAPTMSIKPLLDTGTLRASFTTKEDRTFAQIGSNDIRAKTHQYGRVTRVTRSSGRGWGRHSYTIPARPMIGLTPAKRKRYASMVTNYIITGRV